MRLTQLRPTGIVFDHDGLLVDTEPFWEQAEQAIFAKRGRACPPDLRAQVHGRSVPAIAALFARLLDEPGREESFIAELHHEVGSRTQAAAVPLPGAVELLALLHGKVPLAVASNTTDELLGMSLEKTGLGDWFDQVLSADQVEHGKPAPDLYLAACQRLGVLPADAIAFEDSPTGVTSAKAAGMTVIAVPGGVAPVVGADLVLTTLADPRLRAWAQAL